MFVTNRHVGHRPGGEGGLAAEKVQSQEDRPRGAAQCTLQPWYSSVGEG